MFSKYFINKRVFSYFTMQKFSLPWINNIFLRESINLNYFYLNIDARVFIIIVLYGKSQTKAFCSITLVKVLNPDSIRFIIQKNFNLYARIISLKIKQQKILSTTTKSIYNVNLPFLPVNEIAIQLDDILYFANNANIIILIYIFIKSLISDLELSERHYYMLLLHRPNG